MAVLRAELNKKRRHLPIRQLIDKSGRAIQQIKPVFMMSPMSIANFLPPGKVEFDVVVFDEASQVKAVDAFGAIMRGKQVVVVGDTRQMPPTDFFSREIELDDDDASTADIESILSMFKAAGSQERYLRWHYRSRHESLIAVSNVEFYDNRLVVFPSAGQHPHAKGVSFDYLPHALYDRGRTRTNKEEAKAVAKAVMEHAIRTPKLSLHDSRTIDSMRWARAKTRKLSAPSPSIFANRSERPLFFQASPFTISRRVSRSVSVARVRFGATAAMQNIERTW
ncbi:putative DNA helicase [compost metagenome]